MKAFLLVLSLFVAQPSFAAGREDVYPNLFCVSRVWLDVADAQGKKDVKIAPAGELEFYKSHESIAVPQHPELLYWVTPGTPSDLQQGRMDYRFSVAMDIANNRVFARGHISNGQTISFGYDDRNMYPPREMTPNSCKITSVYVVCGADAATARNAADEILAVDLPAIPANCGGLE